MPSIRQIRAKKRASKKRQARAINAKLRSAGVNLVRDFDTVTTPDINFYTSDCQTVANFRKWVDIAQSIAN